MWRLGVVFLALAACRGGSSKHTGDGGVLLDGVVHDGVLADAALLWP